MSGDRDGLALTLPGTRVRAIDVLELPRIGSPAAVSPDLRWRNGALYDRIASGSTEFLSRDPMVATTRSPYGYVADDPLNGTDPTGRFFGLDTLASAALGAVVSATSTIVGESIHGDLSWRDVATSAATGAVAGAALTLCGPACASGAGAVVANTLASGVAGATTNALEQIGDGRPFDGASVARSGLWGAAGGFAGSFLWPDDAFNGGLTGLATGAFDAAFNRPGEPYPSLPVGSIGATTAVTAAQMCRNAVL